MDEIWKPVEENPSYEISNHGRIRSLRTGKILKTYKKGGYDKIQLYSPDSKVPKKPAIHRLVAKAFLPNPDNKPHIHHKDHNKSNNRADNLEWVTPEENNSYNLCIYPVVVNHRPKSVASRDYYEINGALFTTLTSAAKATGIPGRVIKKLCFDPLAKNFRYIPPKFL